MYKVFSASLAGYLSVGYHTIDCGATSQLGIITVLGGSYILCRETKVYPPQQDLALTSLTLSANFQYTRPVLINIYRAEV